MGGFTPGIRGNQAGIKAFDSVMDLPKKAMDVMAPGAGILRQLLWQTIGVDLSTAEGIQRFRQMPDAEKIKVMDKIGEMAGSSVAVAATAPSGFTTALPAAGAGAVAGRSLSRGVAKIAGLKEPKQSGMDEAKDIANVFIENAAMEGVGRAVPVGYRTGKEFVKNQVKKLVKPTPEGDALKALADKYGITLNLAQRSGRPWLERLEVAADRGLGSTGTVRAFRQEQHNKYKEAINGWLDQIHKGDITAEEFARLADGALSKLQTEFNQQMGKQAAGVANTLLPKPSPDLETGLALRAGNEANRNTFAAWADDGYSNLRANYGGTPIDITKLGEVAGQEIAAIPPGQLEQIFPPSSLKILKAANVHPEVSISPHVDFESKRIMTSVPPEVTLEHAMAARSELLARARQLSGDNKSGERRVLYTLAEALNDATEKGLAKHPDAFNEMTRLNGLYRQMSNKLKTASGKFGNVAVSTIQNSQVPEQIPAQLAASETLINRTADAVSPSTVKPLGVDLPTDPMDNLRRNRFDSMVDKASITDPTTGLSRISPSVFQQKLPPKPTVEALYGKSTPAVEGVGAPALAAREQFLYNSPLPKALKASPGKADVVFNAAFPQKGLEGRVDDTLQVFDEVGQLPEARRGFAQGLKFSSETQNRNVSDERMLNPRTLETNIRKYGETVPKVLGPDTATLEEFVDLGKGITGAEHLYGNTSGTSGVTNVLGTMKRAITNPINTAGELAGGLYGARKFVDPKSYNWMFDPPKSLLNTAPLPRPPKKALGMEWSIPGSEEAAGAVGRMVLPPKEPSQPKDLDSLAPIIDDDIDKIAPIVDEDLDKIAPIVPAPRKRK